MRIRLTKPVEESVGYEPDRKRLRCLDRETRSRGSMRCRLEDARDLKARG